MRITAHLLTILSFWLLAAHWLRAGEFFPMAVSLATPLLLLVRQKWALRLVQAGLLLGAAVWGLTAVELIGARLAEGRPWLRLAAIVGAVAALGVFAALSWEAPALRRPAGERKNAA